MYLNANQSDPVIYDGLGKEVITLVNREMPRRPHEVVFDTLTLPARTCTYRFEA